MSRNEIVIAGFGGQGVILAGNIIGKAAAIFSGKNATQTQDYGPEARGGSCRAQVVISDEPVSYPYAETPEVMVALSQDAYTKYSPELPEKGLLIVEKDLVKVNNNEIHKTLAVPATRLAREVGRAAVANIVVVGFFSAVTQILDTEALKKAVLDSVPKGTEELNTRAFGAGYSYGKAALEAVGG